MPRGGPEAGSFIEATFMVPVYAKSIQPLSSEQKKNMSLFLKNQLFLIAGRIEKIDLFHSELAEFIIHLFKEITSDINKESRVFRFFHCNPHRGSQINRLLAIDNKVGGF